jgi:hypothetical protein
MSKIDVPDTHADLLAEPLTAAVLFHPHRVVTSG